MLRYAFVMLARKTMIIRSGVFLSDSWSLKLWLLDTFCTSGLCFLPHSSHWMPLKFMMFQIKDVVLSRMGFWPRRRRRLVLSLARISSLKRQKQSEFWLDPLQCNWNILDFLCGSFSFPLSADSKCRESWGICPTGVKVWQIYCRESLWGRERWWLKPFRRYWYLSCKLGEGR